jgi:Sugar (and other) transporter
LLTVAPVLLTSVLCLLWLPESPRWLLERHRGADAEKVIREAARVNDSPLSDSFKLAPVASPIPVHAHREFGIALASLLSPTRSQLDPDLT